MLKLFSGIRRTFVRLQRYRHIMAVLMKYGFEELAGIVGRHLKVGLGSKVIPMPARKEIAQATLARRVRLAMEELGPTFIKLGQLLSTRPDLLPVEYIQELELLQDRVSPEKYSIIREEIKKQLGSYPEDIFDRFDPEPIAAASIAQVHRARTKDGQEVVLKIRRPRNWKSSMTLPGLLAADSQPRKRLIPSVWSVNLLRRSAKRSIMPTNAATSSDLSEILQTILPFMFPRFLSRIAQRVF